jgi:hypothetical protein
MKRRSVQKNDVPHPQRPVPGRTELGEFAPDIGPNVGQ